MLSTAQKTKGKRRKSIEEDPNTTENEKKREKQSVGLIHLHMNVDSFRMEKS